jgi:acyl-CoA thioester hydrolase
VGLSEFVYKRRVQYRETDASGLAHFSVFFAYAEEAEHAMWREAGVSVEPHESSIRWPRLSASFEFRRPLRFEDEIEVRLRVVGKSAKTFTYQAIIALDGAIAAIGQHTSICVRRRAGEPIKAIDIPADIASRFEVVPPIDVARHV